MSHAIEKGWKFLIRIKDVHSNGIASGLELPQTAVFDMDINLILTRNQTKSKKQAGYKFMPTVQTFDYLPIGSKEDYPISFRIARFKIADKSRLETGWESTISLLEQGISEGKIRNIQIPILKTMMEATLEQFFQRDVLVQNEISYHEALDEVVSILINGITI